MENLKVYRPVVHLGDYNDLKVQIPKINALIKSCTAIFRKHNVDEETLQAVCRVVQEHYFAELYQYGETFSEEKK